MTDASTPTEDPFRVTDLGIPRTRPDENKPPCLGCEQALWDLTRAIEGLNNRFESLVNAVNVLGAQSQRHTDDLYAIVEQVRGMGQAMQAVGPMGLLKGIMGKG